MRIRIGPDFQIQCILYGKQQNPDCVVRIAVKRALYVAEVCVDLQETVLVGDTRYVIVL